MTSFRLPDVGEGLTEAEIISWQVGPGDHVVADQPLVTIETDKAVVEIPSPTSGHIARLLVEAGDIVQVGDVLVEFADDAHADPGAIVGEIRRAAAPKPDEPPVAGRADTARVDEMTMVDDARPRPRATPAVRSTAGRLGVDLATITPSGAEGTITMADVERAAHGQFAASTQPATAGIELLRGVRRAMAATMARAHAEVVPASVTEDADINDWTGGEDTTVRLIRAIGVACSVVPALNVSFHGRDTGRQANSSVDLGMAVDTDDGLFVPVLHDIANRDPADLRQGLERLKTDVAARTVPPEQLRGQTITLSNFGVFGGRHASLVVVPPQVAIVGAGRARQTVVAHDGQPALHNVLPISLTFDHRVVTGSEAARFLVALVADLETPT